MCSPQDVPAFDFTSPGSYLGKCSSDTLKALYVACVSDNNSIDACNAAKKAHPNCAACVIGSATGSVQHPWIDYDPTVTPFPNYGLCMATVKSETKTSDCGIAYGQYMECLSYACVTPCADDGQTAFDACRQAANDQNECVKGRATTNSVRCQKAYGDSTYGFCTSGQDGTGHKLTEEEFMVVIASLVCGSKPITVQDAGGDADAEAGGK